MKKSSDILELTCKPTFFEDKITLNYLLFNRSDDDVFVLDVLPGYDVQNRKQVPNFDAHYLCWRAPQSAYLLKGIPPLPANKMVTIRTIPLATRLPANHTLERIFNISLPLKEGSSYYSPPEQEDCDIIEIDTIIFAIDFIRTTEENIQAFPAPHGLGFFNLKCKNIVAQAENVQTQIPTSPIKLWKRKDLFSRI